MDTTILPAFLLFVSHLYLSLRSRRARETKDRANGKR